MMRARVWWLVWAGVLGALALVVLGICVGSAGLENLIGPLLNPAQDPPQTAMAQQIVWQIRLPRTLGAWAAGALLGMMNGGVAVSVFSSSLWVRLGLTGAAFLGAVFAVMLTLALSRGVGHTLRLLLAGVVVGVVLGAMTHLVLLFSPESLQAMQAFMLGSTAFVGWTSCVLMAGVWAVCVLAAWLLARVLDGLSLGDATAISLGLPVAPMRAALVAVLALATGTAVAQTGLIAFVGLAAPHLVRSVVKTTHAHLMLLSSLMGGVLLMAADTLARGLMAPQELPVGMLTAVLGGGYLLWLMHRSSSLGGGRAA
jgi:iron complex transport system permease protein